ncbi:cytochrome P450 [Lindgomyces ingoldianus]|uniref:Cytochrome P450 n=1 Tax=Lindgomyces ingoldianus TaxID=673940 RepID=A0ACB6QHX6_9PLEO|nr:cytochrome P450 [Lindgomyces ingoldianus]KAF2465740.1 cytochrome P450 [Lindgomyces ingoldianus]
MSYSTPTAIIVALGAFLLYRFLLYPLVVSPLRHIPAANFISRFSPFWILYHRRNGRQAVSPITHAHTKNGTVILVSPTEVSVSSLEGVKKVYVEKGGFGKPKWWAELFLTYGDEFRNMSSMIGGIGDKHHRTRKADIGNVYSKTYLLGSAEVKMVAERIVQTRLFPALEEAVREREGILEVYDFNGAMNADLGSGLIFGEDGGTHFMKDISSRDGYFTNHATWLKDRPGAQEAKHWMEKFGLERSAAAERQVLDDEEKRGRGEERGKLYPVVYAQLRSRGLKGKQLASETLDHFLAGAEGPRTTVTYVQWMLSKRLDIQARLRKELSAVSFQPSSNTSLSNSIPEFKTLDALPLLDAIITETLRIYPPTPGPMFRITPPGGTTIDGYFIPGNVQISTWVSVLHHNPDVFPRADEWEPDRWMSKSEKDDTRVNEMRRWMFPFGGGSRMCVGKEFALLTMKLTLAAMYSRYETSIVEDDGMEQEDLFLAGPVGEKLVLKFQPLK